MLKENIESEPKIKYELALDTFDVIVNMYVQNYIELPPKPLPAKEVIRSLRAPGQHLSLYNQEFRDLLAILQIVKNYKFLYFHHIYKC